MSKYRRKKIAYFDPEILSYCFLYKYFFAISCKKRRERQTLAN